MNTYRVTLENKGGHERRETITANTAGDAESQAEAKRPGYGAVSCKLIEN